MFRITMTSHERHGVSNYRQRSKHQSSTLLTLCKGNPPVNGTFSSKKRASNAESVSTSWCHHVCGQLVSRRTISSGLIDLGGPRALHGRPVTLCRCPRGNRLLPGSNTCRNTSLQPTMQRFPHKSSPSRRLYILRFRPQFRIYNDNITTILYLQRVSPLLSGK